MKSVRRLAKEYRPKKYQLNLSLYPDEMNFAGTVKIEGHLEDARSDITLHSKDLKIVSVSINGKDAKFKLDPGNDQLIVLSNKLLNAGSQLVEIKFSGTITDPMNGIYPCRFNYQGQAQKLLGTQFESHHAREAFPCIDEPAAKAVFELTLNTPAGETVVANTPIKSQSTKDKRQVTEFEPTPIMSSYLLAFVVGNVKYLEAKTKRGTLVRTYATPDNYKFTQFSLDMAVKTLEFFEDYFKIPYPLAKCDFVALPDFAAGAMENWGCITFREADLLVDPENTSLPQKERVAVVVAHELAHQWFGNLVTMDWWSDLWLNEGFASWIEYLAVDHEFPEWNMWAQFVTEDLIRGQSLDALANTHPVEVEIPHPDEIRNIFDAISYSKGASVIRMLHAYLGPKDFQRGLQTYLNRYKYANASTDDLWATLEEVSKKPVSEFMSAWTKQAGFPVVHASRRSDTIDLKQERFFFSTRERKSMQDKTLWPVAINATDRADNFTLTKAHDRWKIGDTNAVKLNRDQTGFYMVRYDESWLDELSAGIKAGSLSEIDRLGLLSEAFTLAKAGYLPTVSALNLLGSFTQESSLPVWEIILGQLGSVRRVMEDDKLRELIKPYVGELVAKQHDRLGWKESDSDSHQDKILRPIMLGQASFAQNPDVVKECLARFDKMKQPSDENPDIRPVVYGTAAREGDSKTYDKLFEFYTKSDSAQEKGILTGALTGFKQPELVKRALDTIRTDEVRLQDVLYWTGGLFANRHGKKQAWDWMTDNWDWIEEKFGNDIMMMTGFPLQSARAFTSEADAKRYEKFFSKVNKGGLDRPIKQGLETILWQSDWKKRDAAAINQFFSNWKPKDSQ